MTPHPTEEGLEDIRSRASASDVVLIDGGTASGKSTLAASIAEVIAGAVVVSHDAFLAPRASRAPLYPALRSGELTPAAYHERTWNQDALAHTVLAAIEARRARVPAVVVLPRLIDRDTPDGATELRIAPDSLLIVEGFGAMQWDVDGLRSTRVWCEAPSFEDTLRRKVARGGLGASAVEERLVHAESLHDAWNSARGRPLADVLYVSKEES